MEREFKLTTGDRRSRTWHYRMADGRALELIHSRKRHGSERNGWHTREFDGLIVTVRADYGGDWRTHHHTRYFDLPHEADGWP